MITSDHTDFIAPHVLLHFNIWRLRKKYRNINIRVIFFSPLQCTIASSTISFCNKWNTLFYFNFPNTLTSIVFCLMVGICIMYRKPEKMEKACGLFAPAASLASPRFTILSSNHYINTYKARLPWLVNRYPHSFSLIIVWTIVWLLVCKTTYISHWIPKIGLQTVTCLGW